MSSWGDAGALDRALDRSGGGVYAHRTGVSDDQAFIAMKVSALAVDPVSGVPTVLLQDEDGGLSIPVGIGLGEASAIAAELDSIDLERPLTHQLMGDLLEACGARVARVELRHAERMCVASIVVELADGRTAQRSARASDAFALALRCGAPIWVSMSVLDRHVSSGTWAEEPDGAAGFAACELVPEAEALLEQLGPEAFGKWKM